MNMIYHYTRAYRIANIVSSGHIRKSAVYGGGRFRPQEQAVWLTRSNSWEPTACGEERTPPDLGFAIPVAAHARFQIDPAACQLFDWNTYLAKSRLKTAVARTLYKNAKRAGSDVELWRVSFQPIAGWLAVEIERDGEWQGLDVSDLSGFPYVTGETYDGSKTRTFIGMW